VQEYLELSHNEPLLSYSDLMRWGDLQDLIGSGVVSQDKLDQLWAALPKQPLGRFYKAILNETSNNNTFTRSIVAQSDGITVEAFLMFNEAIEDLEASELI